MDEETLRLDKWLWYARFVKTRSLGTELCVNGRIRLQGRVVRKAAQPVRIGDILTFPQGRQVRVVKILALGTRRGPAPEAATLYEDLAPPESPASRPPPAAHSPGRPSKSDRRAIRQLIGRG